MEHLTGLQWSAGLFGLAVGIVIGAVSTWFAMRTPSPVTDDEIHAAFDELVPGDVPAIPAPLEQHAVLHAPATNPLLTRMYERWLDALTAGDRIAMRRQEIRMLANGIDPPTSRGDAEGYLAAVKGDLL